MKPKILFREVLTMIKRSNFSKWFAFAFPYIAQLIYKFVEYISHDLFSVQLEPETLQSIYLLINSLALLFGFKVLSNYTHIDNCKNYSPKNYTH